MLAALFHDYIRKHGLMRPGDRVAAAVSGGADSVALLRLLAELRSELGIALSVAHFNHQIRGAESDGDAAFVTALAEKFALELHSASGDARTHAKECHVSLETAARELRYEFFHSLLKSGRVDRIATGHTLDDQSETVLMKLTRGAGTKGLAGIYPVLKVAHGAIIRPLLATGRHAIETHLRSLNQSWHEDASNFHLRHTRNRIRQELLPLLEKSFNPSIKQTLAETAEIARAEEDHWARVVMEQLPLLFDPHRCSLDAGRLMQHPLAAQRRLLRAAAERAGIMLEFRQVEELRSLMQDPASQNPAHDLSGGRAVFRKKLAGSGPELELRFEQQCPTEEIAESRLSSGYEYRLAWPGEVKIAEIGTIFRVRLAKAESSRNGNPGDLQLLRPELLQSELCLRNWRPGDRYWPAHTARPKKVKELLQRVPQPQRRSWPVVVSGDEIIWMRGFPAPARLLLSAVEAKGVAGVLIEEVGLRVTLAPI